MKDLKLIKIFTDGGSRGNPGPSALGVHIEDSEGETIEDIGKTLGVNTNNFAEYSAIVEALNWVIENRGEMPNLEKIEFYMDSKLAVMQITGMYKVKSLSLKSLLIAAKQKEAEIKLPISYKHVYREQNTKADRMVNLALDNKLSSA